MVDFKIVTKKHKMPMKQEASVYSPQHAFMQHVLPFLGEDWINNSEEVNGTKLSAREWFGLVMTSQAFDRYLGKKSSIGEDEEGGDGLIMYPSQSTYTDFDGIFVEQTLATRKSGATDTIQEIKRVIGNKTSKGPSYIGNKHLVVWADVASIDVKPTILQEIVEQSGYASVTFLASDGEKVYTYLYMSGDPGIRSASFAWIDIINW
jgi:hypothetical protein